MRKNIINIADYLSDDPTEAITAAELCQMLGISNITLKAAIHQERKDGVPICSRSQGDCPGYYLAPDRETMIEFCNRLNHRSREIDRTREYCLKAAEKLPDIEEA